MYDNDLFNQFSEAFHDMLDNLDKGLRDGVGEIKDMKKNVERNGLFGNKKCERKTNYRAPFENFKKNLKVPDIENPFVRSRKIRADVIKTDGQIIIRAQREFEEVTSEEDKPKNYDQYSDRFYGKAERSFKVGKIDVTTVRANFQNGILTITCDAPEDGAAINID